MHPAQFRISPVYNFHGAPTKHKAWPDHDRVAQLVGHLEGGRLAGHHCARGLLDVQLGQQLVPLVPVLALLDVLRLRAPDLDVAIACMQLGFSLESKPLPKCIMLPSGRSALIKLSTGQAEQAALRLQVCSAALDARCLQG